jgi:hypothetical protein
MVNYPGIKTKLNICIHITIGGKKEQFHIFSSSLSVSLTIRLFVEPSS